MVAMTNAPAHVGDGSMRWCGVLQPDAGICSVRARSVQSEPTARVSVDRVKNPALLSLWEKLSSIARQHENVLDVEMIR